MYRAPGSGDEVRDKNRDRDSGDLSPSIEVPNRRGEPTRGEVYWEPPAWGWGRDPRRGEADIPMPKSACITRCSASRCGPGDCQDTARAR